MLDSVPQELGGERAAVVHPALSRWLKMLRASLSFLQVLAQPPAEGEQQGESPGLGGEPWGSGPRKGWREVREFPRQLRHATRREFLASS